MSFSIFRKEKKLPMLPFSSVLTVLTHSFLREMIRAAHLNIPDEHFPKVYVIKPNVEKALFPAGCEAYYSPDKRHIGVVERNALLGPTFPPDFCEHLGEEIGHFLRCYFKECAGIPSHSPEPEQGWLAGRLVDEFYGYIGRKLLFESQMGGSDFVSCFPLGKLHPLCSKKDVVALLHSIRWQRRSRLCRLLPWLLRYLGKDDESILAAKRKSILTHRRGYEFAAEIDLSNIHDWKAFLSLPDDEVRRRFFREDPDYSGL